jgi:adenylate kinase family enzyme
VTSSTISFSFSFYIIIYVAYRFRTYEGETRPVLNTMRDRGLLRTVSSMEPVDVVWNAIKSLFTA